MHVLCMCAWVFKWQQSLPPSYSLHACPLFCELQALEVIFGVKLGSAEDFMKEEQDTKAAAAAAGGSAAAAAASMAEELRSSSKENQPSTSNTAAAGGSSSKADAKSAAADVEMEEASEEAAAKKQVGAWLLSASPACHAFEQCVTIWPCTTVTPLL
jgi:hypothetical protein